MAKRKAATVTREKGVVVVSAPAAAAPVRRRRSSGAITRRSKGGGVRRRRSGGGSSDSSYKNQLIGTAFGGFGYGWIEKHYGSQIPSIPILGKSGTVAVACYMFRGKHAVIKDIGIAAAAIAGYTFGKEGKVSGEDEYDENQ